MRPHAKGDKPGKTDRNLLPTLLIRFDTLTPPPDPPPAPDFRRTWTGAARLFCAGSRVLRGALGHEFGAFAKYEGGQAVDLASSHALPSAAPFLDL